MVAMTSCQFRIPGQVCEMRLIARWAGVRFAIVCLLALPLVSQAQWVTQSLDLKPGWNAVFLQVDASHTTLNALMGSDLANPILEVWRWSPPSTLQFIEGPQQPVNTLTEWTSWSRTEANPALQRIAGNSAYLIRVGSNVTTYTYDSLSANS